MRKIILTADSTIDLTPELIKSLDIRIIPLSINFTTGSYHDGTDLTTGQMYDKIAELNELPHTAAVTPGEFMEFFETLIKEDYDILFTCIGSKFSKTYENALLISKEFEPGRIAVVDSQNLSSGTSLLLMKAAKMREEGKSLSEIAQMMEQTAPLVRSQFAIEKMDFLHKGGRCSGVAKLFGTLLKIKPIIIVRDGAMSVGSKPHGKMVVALDKMLGMLTDEGDNVDPDCIFVTHSFGDESAKYLLPKVKALFPNTQVVETYAGCVISAHCGKGTIGILYIKKHL